MRTVPVVHATLADWFPFLAYGVIAFLIPASMVAMSFIFGAKPQKSRAK